MSDIKTIRFIDSKYNELFCIPDGAGIRVTYPPGDGRGTVMRACKFLDEHHTRIGNDDYHICEWAEHMEALGAKYEPEVQLHGAELVPFASGEEKFLTYNREEGNTCIGHMRGEFGRAGDRFFHSWSDRENGRNTAEFNAELHSAVYLLRAGVLKDHAAMTAYCQSHPEAKLPGRADLEHYGFRMDTKARKYFLLCTLEDSGHFILYAYDNIAPVLEKAAREPVAAASEKNMFYRDDTDKQRVGHLRGDFGKCGNEFWHSWFDAENDRNTPEFKAELQNVMDSLRRGILKDRQSSSRYCSNHPEAALPGRDGYHYGFKLETEARQYFIRCTTLRDDYFYVFARDKEAPNLEKAAGKPSVLEQIREAKKAPAAPCKEKQAHGKGVPEL